jgi:predicted ribosomally synthesized peptide with nif11-like leader
MSRKELERFLGDLEADAELARAFAPFGGDLDAAVRWVNARGYDVTREEAAGLDFPGELSDDELDVAAGGWTDPTPPPPGTTS